MVELLKLIGSIFTKSTIGSISTVFFKSFVREYKIVIPVIIFVICSIFLFDKTITDHVINMKSAPALFFSAFGYILGQFQYVFLTNLLLSIIFILSHQRVKLFVVFASLHAMVFSGIFVQIPKYLFGRTRPFAGYDPHSFFNNYSLLTTKFFEYSNMSMPSGDTITIAAAASVFALYTKSKIARLFFYSVPVITMFTRVHQSKHWFSDTCVGYLMGFLIAKAVFEFYKERIQTEQNRLTESA